MAPNFTYCLYPINLMAGTCKEPISLYLAVVSPKWVYYSDHWVIVTHSDSVTLALGCCN